MCPQSFQKENGKFVPVYRLLDLICQYLTGLVSTLTFVVVRIAVALFNYLECFILCLLILFSTWDNPAINTLVRCLCIWITNVAVLAFIFFPKLSFFNNPANRSSRSSNDNIDGKLSNSGMGDSDSRSSHGTATVPLSLSGSEPLPHGGSVVPIDSVVPIGTVVPVAGPSLH
jgi:hypothetical protein